jgi:predicted DCC family thiol-disulfide oxidoreductase YuxK
MSMSLEKLSGVLPDNVKAVVLFDGECVLCNRAVTLMLRLDRGCGIKIASQNSAIGQRLMTIAGFSPSERASMVVVSREGLHTESDAVIEVATALGLPFSLLRVGRLIPSKVRDAVYSWVARNRYRWFGKTTECGLIPRDRKDIFFGEVS